MSVTIFTYIGVFTFAYIVCFPVLNWLEGRK